MWLVWKHFYRRLGTAVRALRVVWRFRALLCTGRAYFADERHADDLKRRLIASGPLYVKMGQWLAQRPDLIPSRFTRVLQTLQNDAPQHSFSDTQQLVEASFGGRRLSDVFAHFTPTPVASGSIAQVHCATLRDPQCMVAVKVRHPGIVERLQADVDVVRLLLQIGRWIVPHYVSAVDMDAVLNEMLTQCSMRTEASALAAFQGRFFGSNIRFPSLVHCTDDNVLVETWLAGVYVRDVDDESTRHLTKCLTVAAYLQMMLIDGVAHGDLHNGNLLVNVCERSPHDVARDTQEMQRQQQRWHRDAGDHEDTIFKSERVPHVYTQDVSLAFVDFGIVLHLDAATRHHVTRLLEAAYGEDRDAVCDCLSQLTSHTDALDRPRVSRALGDAFSEVERVRDASPSRTVPVSVVVRALLDVLYEQRVRLSANVVRALVNFILIEEGHASERRHDHVVDNALAYVVYHDEDGTFSPELVQLAFRWWTAHFNKHTRQAVAVLTPSDHSLYDDAECTLAQAQSPRA